jgi:hypothetical protein
MRGAIRRAIRWLSYRSFKTAYRFERAAFRRATPRGERRVVVYTRGKSGSESILRSLEDADPSLRVHHVHTLSPPRVARMMREYGESFPVKPMVPRHLLETDAVRRELEAGGETERFRVVTTIRDPVAREVSSFFQVMPRRVPEDVYGEWIADPERPGLLEELEKRFVAEARVRSGLDWFAEEMEPVFGVDVFAAPFPRGAGYAIYTGARADVLLIRVEDLSRVAAAAFREFLGMEDFRLERANVAEDKEYDALYRAFLARARLPVSFLDEMYGARLARHFYSEAEIAGFRAAWER